VIYWRKSKQYNNPVILGEIAKSAVFVPMKTGENVSGIISLQNLDHEYAFSDSDVRLITTLSNSMSIALESARLFDETKHLLKETEQRNAELAVINSVQDGLVREMDIQGIYDLVGEKMREIFDAQVIDIVTYDRKANTIEDRYSFEKGDRTLLGKREPMGFRKHVIENMQALYFNEDVEKHAKIYNNPVLTGESPKSLVFVPMIAGNEVTGVISLQNVDHERAFSASDISLLKTLSNSMSVALESARLFDETTRLLKETEQRTAELAVINSVQEGLAKELDMQGIYNLVGDRVQKLFNAQTVIIASFDSNYKVEHFNYFFENNEKLQADSRPINKLRQLLIDRRRSIYIATEKQAREEYGLSPIGGTQMTKSLLFVPLLTGNLIRGYVSLQNIDTEYAFSDSDIRLLETVANSMSVALENARLFDETNRLLKETEQRTAELAVINSVQEGLAKELDMQGIYNLVGDRVQKLFNAQAVIIASFDPDYKVEHFNYFFENNEKVQADSRPINKLRQLLIDRKRSIYISTERQAREEYGLSPIPGTQMTRSNLFVPLLTGNLIRGYVSLQNLDTENAFSESDIRLLETVANSMSVALENARLFDETNRLLKETEQRTTELAVINSVQEGLARELNMQAIYELVGEKIREIFNAQVIDIVTYDETTNLITDRYTYEKGDRTLLAPRPLKGFRRYVIQTKKLLVINKDVEGQRSMYDNTVMIGEAAKSLVFVPMIAGDKVAGVISLQNLDQEDAFPESDVRLLTTLVSSMSVALENARLFDETNRLLKETEQRTAELGIINSVQEGLASKLDIQAVYDLVGDKIRDVFDTQGISISYYDRQKNFITHPYYLFEGKRIVELGFELGKGLTSHIIHTAQPLLINERAAERFKELGAVFASSETEDTTKSWLGVPLISGGQVNGTIRLENYEREFAYTESDVSLLQTLANSMSVALENARLFDETNRLLKETEQRTAELAVINSVQEGLAKELDIQGIYNLVGDRLCDLFPDSQTLVIRTFDHEKGQERWQYAREKGSRQYVDPRPFNWNSKLLIETRKPLDIRENYVQIAKVHGSTGVTAGQPPKSAVFVPMMVGDVVKGSVSLQSVDKENAFSDADLRLLTTITNSMSVALENARLFDETNRLLKETEQKTAELAVINSVQEGLVREMHIQAIYDLVGTRICQLFDTQTVIIRTFEHRTQVEHWQYAIEKGQRLYSNPRPIIWANKLIIESKQALLINNNYLETAQKYGGAGVSKGLPPKSGLFVPMIVGDVVRGSVSLQNVEKENAFTESDLRLLTTLTNSMSVAIENARLFDETNRLLGEAKQRAAELSTVNSISQALTSQLNTEELIKLVGDQMKNLFNANIVYLALLDAKTKIIHFPYMEGDTLTPMKLGKGLTSKIILSGKPLLINKEVTAKAEELGITSVGVPAASYLGVPIPVGDEIIGVLSVQSTESENRFNENDERLLSTIAASVGVALRKAQLFEEVSTARKQAEEASKIAEKANQAKSAFLSTVSHELRTPLTSVLGFAKIIKKRLDEKIFPATSRADPKIEKTIQQVSDNLKVVVSEGERLTNLINEVLDLAKIEAGKMEWNMESVSMLEVMERATAATTSLFEQKNLTLEKYIDPDLPLISGDRDKLIQVVVNLISNAVKFTPAGKVVCKATHKKNEIIVGIQDTGIGIAPHDHAAVFEQFKQVVGDTLTDKPKGTGLGLPICKEIVEHHDGRIWLESELGKGSTFYFALPIPKTDGTRPVQFNDLVKQLQEQMAQSKLTLNGKHATILVVDDDDSIRSLLQQELGDAGYLIEEAKNGKEALASVRNHRPDLIILDVMMPEMNGFDVAAVLKNDPETMDIPIIVLSIVQDKARGFRIGVDRYLTKPIDTNQLFSEVGSLLEQGKSKKKVMVVDEDTTAVRSLTDVLQAKGYQVVESDGKELVQKAISTQPDIIILNSIISDQHEIVQSLRFEKGLENVLFLVYQ
jgi:GAF domain-containing protein/CheY-like chemotaxis protein